MSRRQTGKKWNNYRKKSATFTHLSALTQYFIPFEILFFNTILDFKKDESEFVDYSGKQILNFQLSLLLYTIGLALIAIRFYFNHFNNVPVNAIIHDDNFMIDHFTFGTT
jgi:uncharacterized Tic20 family protein